MNLRQGLRGTVQVDGVAKSNEKTADMDGLRYSPEDPYYRLGPVHTCLYVRVRETGDWDLFLGPLEWARAETGGADRWVL